MSHTLRILTGARAGDILELLPNREVTVGRDVTCTLALTGNNISRLHAIFRLRDGVPMVENRSSTNGTYINGVRRDSTDLKRWDTVVIGPTVLRVEQVNEALGREHALFACLLEISRILGEGGDRMIEHSLEALFLALPVNRLAIFTRDTAGDPVQGPTSARGATPSERMSHSFAKQVFEAGKAVLLEEASQDDPNGSSGNWGLTLQRQAVRTILGVPVLVKGHVHAVLLGDNLDQPGLLDRTHLQVLEWAAKSLEAVFQREELKRLEAARMRTEYEIEAGRAVQRHLFTKDPSNIPGPLRWAACYRPALELGGDFYDYHLGDDGAVTWIVADVSGKGVPAALVASMLKIASKTLHRTGISPKDLIQGLHNHLHGEIPNPMYFTAIVLRACPDGTLHWCSVGHPAGLILRTNGTRELLDSSPGMLGMRNSPHRNRNWGEGTQHLEPGDRVALFTDGVTEAMSPTHVDFGEENAWNAIAAQATEDLPGAINGIIAALKAHCQSDHFSDDVTLVIGERPHG